MTGHGDVSGAMGAAGAGPGRIGEQGIPAQVRGNWEAAEAEISNMLLAAPDLYERAFTLVRLTADALRPRCTDLTSLLAAADRPEDSAAVVAEAADAAGVSTAALRLDLIASVALAMRSREIAGERAREARLARLTQAREERQTWTLVEEFGHPDRALVTPYRRVDVHVSSGVALIASIEPDETFARAVYRLEWARLDPATGGLVRDEEPTGAPAEYDGRRAWEAASAEARQRLA